MMKRHSSEESKKVNETGENEEESLLKQVTWRKAWAPSSGHIHNHHILLEKYRVIKVKGSPS